MKEGAKTPIFRGFLPRKIQGISHFISCCTNLICLKKWGFHSFVEQIVSIKMVQTPFSWRYGGRQVSVSGSFNGWSERVQMVLVEGSENVFQIIIDLPPGFYQYKFLVDDTWRVDEQQICHTDEYGTRNNVVLVSSTEFIPPVLNTEALQQPITSRANAAVIPSVGSSSGGSLNEPVLQLPSEGERNVFRQVLSVHLLSSTMYELIPNSGKAIVALDVEVDVEQAFHVMHDLRLTVVTLWDSQRGQMAGMLTASDFILMLLQLHRNHPELAVQTISSWKGWKLEHHRDIIRTMAPLQRRPFIYAGPDDSLADVASRILQNNISSVPILHSVNGSCPRLLHVACLAGILKNICSHFRRHLGHVTVLRQPIGYLPLGTWDLQVRRAYARPLFTLRLDDLLTSALTLLLEAQIGSIPILNNEGNFVNMYSRSDITSLAKDNIYRRMQLNQMTISQALELNNERVRMQYHTCTRFDSLFRVMELLCQPDVRRLIVVEAASQRLEGIITLRDVFDFFSR